MYIYIYIYIYIFLFIYLFIYLCIYIIALVYCLDIILTKYSYHEIFQNEAKCNNQTR